MTHWSKKKGVITMGGKDAKKTILINKDSRLENIHFRVTVRLYLGRYLWNSLLRTQAYLRFDTS